MSERQPLNANPETVQDDPGNFPGDSYATAHDEEFSNIYESNDEGSPRGPSAS